mgnify:CR=1 FL=1
MVSSVPPLSVVVGYWRFGAIPRAVPVVWNQYTFYSIGYTTTLVVASIFYSTRHWYNETGVTIRASSPCAVMTSFRLTSQRRHASWLPPRKLILHSILGIDIPIPVPRITGASLAPGTATIGDGALRAPSESTGMVAIPLEPRVS